MRRLAGVIALLILAVLPSISFGSRAESWRSVGSDEFRRGRIEDLALDPDGVFVLAPARRELGRWDDAGAWSLAASKEGSVFVGTGDQGRIYRVSAAGKAEVFADLEELEVHALAVDADGGVLAGSSPNGKVYRIGKDGKSTVLFDPEDRYIWAVVPLRDGAVLVATGDKARLYKVDRSGKSTVLYESPDPHLRSVAVSPDGAVYLGTSGRGLVLKLDKEGHARVLLDSKLQEIVVLAFDATGDLYAAGVGEERRAAVQEGVSAAITVTAEAPPPEGARGEGPEKPQETRPPATGPAAGAGAAGTAAAPPLGAEVFRIEKDGFSRRIWKTRTETVYALAPREGGGVYLGTGPDGTILGLDAGGRATWFGNSEKGPVSALAQVEGRLLILGATPASLRSMGPELAESGTIQSRVFDAHLFSLWGKLRWVLERGREGSVSMAVRSGNTEEPDATWSDWAPVPAPQDPSEGSTVGAPPSRYVQWRATLKRETGGLPALSEVELRFRSRNVAPTIQNVAVLPPGIGYQVQPSGGQPGGEATLLPNRYAEAVSRLLSGGRRPPSNYRKFYLPGSRTVTWEGGDENGDDLAFTVECQRRDETRWRPLGKNVTETFLTWDSRGLADGWYRLRVAGSDRPDNPAEEELAAQELSQPFVVDNTPPRIEDLEATLTHGKAMVHFRASDSAGRITLAEYAVDGGEWRVLIPEDRVEDSRIESYRFEIDLANESLHVIVVRAADEGGNWASEQAEVRR